MTISKRDNVSMGSAGLAIGSTTSQISTANLLHYLLNGRAFSKAATATVAFGFIGTAVVMGLNQVMALFVCLDSAGAVTTIQTAAVPASTNAIGYVPGAFEWPDPQDKVVIGAVLIKSGGSAFTVGTTALTGVATYINAALDYGKPIQY